VVVLQLGLRTALPALAAVPKPDQLLDVVGDHIPPPRQVLWLHAHRNRGLRPLDVASLTLRPCRKQGVTSFSFKSSLSE
jgi:hypothetical protein